MSIEAWVTQPDGTLLANLERSEASPFRRFAFRPELGATGRGMLEYHLDNELVASIDDLFAPDNFVWMRFRGKTFAWLVEDRETVLDENEHASDWVRISGKGTRALLGHRIVWPTKFDEDNTDPLQWGLGDYSTKTDASAAGGQNVVPVASTVGASVGIPVKITGGGNSQLGIVDAIDVGNSITLKDNLAFTFPVGSRVIGAAQQWRRFVNRPAGEMLWDLINESNGRFTADTGQAPIVRGIVETTGTDGWTQDLRFDRLEQDVVADVEAVFGDVEMEGLTFNYRKVQGVDRTGTVIFEEGADLVEWSFRETVGEGATWAVLEGTGEAVYAKITPKAKPKRRARKTPVRRKIPVRRKAPEAPKKVEYQRVEFPTFVTAEESTARLRREAYVDAKDVENSTMLDELGRAFLEEGSTTDQVNFEAVETRFLAVTDYWVGDWVRAIAPSRGADEDVRIVAMSIAESDDGNPDKVTIKLDVNSRRTEDLINLKKSADKTRSSVGVRNRQPQGQLVPFPIVGAGPFDTDDTAEVHFWLPDELSPIIRCQVAIDFRQFSAPAKASSSGGASTSGASSASSSNNGSANFGLGSNATSGTSGAASAGTAHTHPAGTYADANAVQTDGGHNHGIPHTHTTPNHTHGLDYGIFKEAYPASHSVIVKVYELVDTTFTVRATISGLVLDREVLDLLPYVTGAGQWMLTLQSAAAQPNGGRLFAHVSGYAVGAMQSA